MSLDKKFVRNLKSLEGLFENIRRGKKTAVFGMSEFHKAFALHGFSEFTLFITADYTQAMEILAAVNSYGNDFVYLPPREEVLFKVGECGSAFTAQRSEALYAFVRGSAARGVVTTIDAALQKYPYFESFKKNIINLKKGACADILLLAERLKEIGYRRDEDLPYAGTFTRRGDILDVFCPGTVNPVRLEFFGDVIEDLRIVDRETKKSLGKAGEIDIIPLSPFFREDFDAAKLAADVNASRKRQRLSPDAAARLEAVCGRALEETAEGTSADSAWALPFVKHSVLSEYLPGACVVVFDEPKRLSGREKLLTDEHFSRGAQLLEKGEILPEHAGQLLPAGMLPLIFENRAQAAFSSISAGDGIFTPDEIINVRSTPAGSYRYDVKLLAQDLKVWTESGFKAVIFGGDAASCGRLAKELAFCGQHTDTKEITDYRKILGAEGDSWPGYTVITPGEVKRGFISHEDKLVFIGRDDVFARRKSAAKLRKSAASVFIAPEIGDYVVHETHGIGLCEGVVTLNGSFGIKDFILVSYRGGDKLYVPVESANLLARYSGGESKPKLNRLGGGEFEKVKAGVKKRIKEMAINLAKLYAEREKPRGFVYAGGEYFEQRFSEAFPYEETPDQLKCIADVFKDLETDKIMDRLICGDVGYGKTEVALRAAFKVILSGRQVAFLSPTTILCEQHFRTASGRFAEFGVNTGCLNRFRSKKEQKEIIGKLEDGSLNFICGTHRLLSKDVKFENLGLLILDEEQRFGVEAKETIKSLKQNVDVLTLSATPIPRTLHMALTGMRDISVILTPPKERLPVQTSVAETNENLIRNVILREIGRGGQVFLVYNRVETIDAFAAKMQKLVPEARFAVGHGQMDETALEDSIYKFSNGLFDVLVSSAIIENGIDIPNANTLIVYDADNFGLSQLYQLRGRVGRSDRPAYAYFMYAENKILSETAYKRLSSVLEYTELGSGFKIAVRDLEIRGAGNVLGREQHGHMEKVGYDMYCRLLAESAGEIKGRPAAGRERASVDIALDASAAGYIEDNEARMSFYQRLSDISSATDVETLKEEISDIFGPPPEQTLNLLEIAAFRLSASAAGLSEVVVRPGAAYVCFKDSGALKQPFLFAALEKFKKNAQLDISKKLRVDFKWSGSAARTFDDIKEFVALIRPK